MTATMLIKVCFLILQMRASLMFVAPPIGGHKERDGRCFKQGAAHHQPLLLPKIQALARSEPRIDEYEEDEEEDRHFRNLILVAKKPASQVRKLQCKAAVKPLHSQTLKNHLSELKRLLMADMYDEDESKSESHTEICYRNDDPSEFDEAPPTLDPNLLPPTTPETQIKSNNSVLVSWQAFKRDKYPIDYFLVEFYQYNGTTFCSKCCTLVKNEIKNKTSDSYHEELIDALEPNFEYKFRVAASYPMHNQSWGPWGEQIHLPADFKGDKTLNRN